MLIVNFVVPQSDQCSVGRFPLAVVLRGSMAMTRGRIFATRDEPLGSASGPFAEVNEVFHVSYRCLTSGRDFFHLAVEDATGQLLGAQTKHIG